MSESLELIVHGTHCPDWSEPATIEGWKALELITEKVDDEGLHQVSVCPACGAEVMFFMDHGTIDFGIGDVLGSGDEAAFMETFQAIVKRDHP